MSWETVDQALVNGDRTRNAPCSACLTVRKGGHVRLWISVSPALAETLGWLPGASMVMSVGRGVARGLVRVTSGAGGRLLRILPGGKGYTVELAVPEDLAQWQGPRTEAEHEIAPGGTLVVRLPWVLPMDDAGFYLPPESSPEDAAADGTDDEAEAAAA